MHSLLAFSLMDGHWGLSTDSKVQNFELFLNCTQKYTCYHDKNVNNKLQFSTTL